jgi:hypothetical protein
MLSPSDAPMDERHACCDQQNQTILRACAPITLELKPPDEAPSCVHVLTISFIVRVSWQAADEKRATTAGSVQGGRSYPAGGDDKVLLLEELEWLLLDEEDEIDEEEELVDKEL